MVFKSLKTTGGGKMSCVFRKYKYIPSPSGKLPPLAPPSSVTVLLGDTMLHFNRLSTQNTCNYYILNLSIKYVTFHKLMLKV